MFLGIRDTEKRSLGKVKHFMRAVRRIQWLKKASLLKEQSIATFNCAPESSTSRLENYIEKFESLHIQLSSYAEARKTTRLRFSLIFDGCRQILICGLHEVC